MDAAYSRAARDKLRYSDLSVISEVILLVRKMRHRKIDHGWLIVINVNINFSDFLRNLIDLLTDKNLISFFYSSFYFNYLSDTNILSIS